MQSVVDEIPVLDAEGNAVPNADMEKGYTTPGKRLVQHHEAIQFAPAVYEDVLVSSVDASDDTYGHAGEMYEHRLVTPQVEYQPDWDEYEDVLIYTAYTAEELAQKEKEKKEAEEAQKQAQAEAAAQQKKQQEQQKFLDSAPERVSKLETSQLDTDQAIVSLYEALTSATSVN